MIGIVADYSSGYPGAAALKAAGFAGAVRYIGLGTSGKRATLNEVRDYAANSLPMWAVAESTTAEANNGYAAGVNDAHIAEADRISLGLPSNQIIFAANDQSIYDQIDVDYVRGFRDVLGMERVGAYGFWDFLASVHANGLASAYWQAGHPPGLTGTGSFVNLWQRQGTQGTTADGPGTPTTKTVNGVVCDINTLYRPIGAIQMEQTDAALGYDGQPAKDKNGQGFSVAAELYGTNVASWDTNAKVVALGAQVAGLVSAVAALTAAVNNETPLTAAQLTTIIDQAVATHVQITGTVQITSTPPAP